MTRLRLAILSIIIVIIFVTGGIFFFAPETSNLEDNPETDTPKVICLTDDTGGCLRLPVVSGVDVDNDAITFPEAFDSAYMLIVMPFDREQQVNAITWLPIFQELSAEYDNINFYNIAALPELNLAIRALVMGGMSAGIREDGVRDRTTVLFLQEQDRFLEALTIENTEQIAVFIMGQDGIVFYRDSGAFTTEAGDALRDALEEILSPL